MIKRLTPALLAFVFSVGLMGCEQEGSLEEAGEEAGEDADQAMDRAGEQMEETGEETQSPPPQQP